ncbi:MAG: type I pullulanase [Ruminococcaceae bacterium]|nr:type I pullulanase [Oscillospiraceae bacterium]
MKKRMLRGISLVLSLVLLMGMAACSGAQPEETVSTEPTNPTLGQEYTLPLEDGFNQVTFYWKTTKSIENCDMWIWWAGKDGSGNVFHPWEHGGKVVVNIPEGVDQIGFIVRRDCSEPGGSAWGSATKDYESDRFATITGKETTIYLKTGDPDQYISKDGGTTLEKMKNFSLAGMTDFQTIEYHITPAVTLNTLDQVKVYQNGQEVKIQSVSTLGKSAASGAVVLEEKLDISKPYEIEIEGFDRKAVMPTKIFDSKEFLDNYTYDGKDLGAVIKGSATAFKVWAPTASKVVLNLFAAGNDCEAFANVEMKRGEKGVWEYTQPNCGHGVYYTYSVTASAGTQEATDPYAKAAGVNGDRSMVVDLSKTNPAGWGKPFDSGISSYSDAVIWEVHVRDFSNKLTQSKYPGKYLAFTERGLTNSSGVAAGVDYLVNLGVTHVHLLPVYDYATIDETKLDTPQFNWGYDPKNFNVPEGSYSTDPYHGEVRIHEYKQMVQGLHNAGLGVVMDVVYNHTYDANSAFNKIVPYYYYRYTSTGANSSASGCGNDTASERYMFRKFMVDSVSYWAKEYQLDGFRFDLMGLHDVQTMQEIEKAVHAINPKAIIYGEGWTMGATIDGSAQANQQNINQITPHNGGIGSVAVFNDVIRDGLKGSTFDKLSQGYISGANILNERSIRFGISGGDVSGAAWTAKNNMTINYMSAHDNHTLWDKLALSNGNDTVERRLAMNRLGAGIIMISQGTPFMQAGEEMLRSKDGDENSYKSSDEINNIRWDALTPDSQEYAMMQYYKGLIAMRKAYGILGRDGEATVTFSNFFVDGLAVQFEAKDGSKALALINPTPQKFQYELDGDWSLVADGTHAGAEAFANERGTVSVEGYTIRIYVK